MKTNLLWILPLLLFSSHAFPGGIASGGLPMFDIPADVSFNCQASLGIYLVNGEEKNYAVFNRSFVLKAKKGDRRGGSPRVQAFFSATPEAWILDPKTVESKNLEVFTPYLKERHSMVVNFQWADYAKTDVVDVSLYLGTPDPDELWTTRSVRLSESNFDLEIMHRIRTEKSFSAVNLKSKCVQGDK